MYKIYYADFSWMLPICVNFLVYWLYFFKTNFYSVSTNSSYDNELKQENTESFIHYSFFCKLNLVYLSFFILFMFFYSGFLETVWWNHFKITNFFTGTVIFLVMMNMFYMYILNSLSFFNKMDNNNFIFSIMNLGNFLPIIFFSNTLFTFFFVLELNAVLVFFMFVSSKMWYKSSNTSDNKKSFDLMSNDTKPHMNMLFFHYWASFFSSVMLMYVMMSFLSYYNSCEWLVVNLLFCMTLDYFTFFEKISISLLFSFFMFSFFMKTGMTPFHLYKMEVYKGQSYFTMFFYSTYYFFVFFFYFSILMFMHFNSLANYFWYVIFFLIFMGCVYMMSLLFDTVSMKSFVAYSTMVNSLMFLILMVSVFT